MDENDFEGTLILERFAELGKIDVFLEAIDSDDFGKVQLLMKRAKFDSEAIAIVLKMMAEASGEKG